MNPSLLPFTATLNTNSISLVDLSLFANHAIITLPNLCTSLPLLFLALILGSKLVSNANNIKHATNDVSINGYNNKMHPGFHLQCSDSKY